MRGTARRHCLKVFEARLGSADPSTARTCRARVGDDGFRFVDPLSALSRRRALRRRLCGALLRCACPALCSRLGRWALYSGRRPCGTFRPRWSCGRALFCTHRESVRVLHSAYQKCEPSIYEYLIGQPRVCQIIKMQGCDKEHRSRFTLSSFKRTLQPVTGTRTNFSDVGKAKGRSCGPLHLSCAFSERSPDAEHRHRGTRCLSSPRS